MRVELDNLRYPVRPAPHRVRFQCFGNFEVYIDGHPVLFRREKTKEYLAYLVDRETMCTGAEIAATLWDGNVNASYLRTLRKDLTDTFTAAGCADVLINAWQLRGIRADLVDCDYYDWKRGKPWAVNAYRGEYMTQYSWAELAHGTVENPAKNINKRIIPECGYKSEEEGNDDGGNWKERPGASGENESGIQYGKDDAVSDGAERQSPCRCDHGENGTDRGDAEKQILQHEPGGRDDLPDCAGNPLSNDGETGPGIRISRQRRPALRIYPRAIEIAEEGREYIGMDLPAVIADMSSIIPSLLDEKSRN